MEHAKQQGASERHACQLVHQPRGTQRYQLTQRNDEDALTQAIIALASQYGRYGYRRITIKLQEAGWNVGKDLSLIHIFSQFTGAAVRDFGFAPTFVFAALLLPTAVLMLVFLLRASAVAASEKVRVTFN